MRIASRFFAGLIVLGAMAPAFGEDRKADDILKDIRGLKPPMFVNKPGEDRQKLIEAYMAEAKTYSSKRAELIGELAKADPENAELTTMLPMRWVALAQIDKSDEALKEIDATLAKTKSEKLKTEGHFAKAQISLMKGDAKAAAPAIDEFVKVAPKDPRAPQLLYSALRGTEGDDAKAAIEDRLLKDFPDSQYAGMIKGARKQKESVGKPFELAFTDAIKGSEVSIKGLKGKVVVIDFWATWCGPCIAEMPNMKKLYAEYKDKGVEFIGVSLDQSKEMGGLDKLKDYVAKNDVQWPQYYQGDYWNSAFSKGWGINAIPCVFVVDQDGNLFSVEARGKLDKMIPELLKKGGKGDAGAGGQ